MIKAISFKANTQTPAVELKDNTQEKPAEEKKSLTKNQKIGLGTALAVLAAGGIYLATRGKADGSSIVKSGQQAGADLEKNGKKIITEAGNGPIKTEEEVITGGRNGRPIKTEEEVTTGSGNGPIKAEEEVITGGGKGPEIVDEAVITGGGKGPEIVDEEVITGGGKGPEIVDEEVITGGGKGPEIIDEEVTNGGGKSFEQCLEEILKGEENTHERVAKSKSGISLKNRIRNAFSGIKVRFSTNTKANKSLSEIAEEIKENPTAKPKKSYNPFTALDKRINSWIDKQADEKTIELSKVSRMQKIRNYFAAKNDQLGEWMDKKIDEIDVEKAEKTAKKAADKATKAAEKAKQPPKTPLKETVSKWYNEQPANMRNKYNAFVEKRKTAVKPSSEPTVVSTEPVEKNPKVVVGDSAEQEKVLLGVTGDEFDGIANV